MLLGTLVSLANLLAIIGIGLFVLFSFRLLPRLNGWERVALAIPVGFGFNGWFLFLLGVYGYLNP